MDPDTEQKLGDLADRAERQRRRFRARSPKAVGPVIAQVIAKRGYAATRGSEALAEAWAAAVGEPLAAHTRAAGLRRGVLEVMVANSTMLQEINFDRPRLLKAVQASLPDTKIKSLKLKIGRVN